MRLQALLLLPVVVMALGGGTPTRPQGPGESRASVAEVQVSEFIFEKAPFPQCHASTIVEPRPGVFLAAWFGGTREGARDVGIWLSRHERERWTPPVEVAIGVEPGGERYPTWNPVLFAPEMGRLLLFYKVGPSPSRWWGMVKSSADEGATWGPPQRLPKGVIGPIKNKPVVLPGGAWLSPSSTEDPVAGWQLQFEISRDQGRTWQVVGPIDKGPGLEAIQPSILFHRAGRLQAVCRTRSGVVATTWSRDQGKTWEPLSRTALPNPNSGIDAVTLRDGRHLLVYNHSSLAAAGRSGARYPLNMAISDDGVTWKPLAALEEQPLPDGYAYPAVIQSSDGLVHITYTWNRERIKHVVLRVTS